MQAALHLDAGLCKRFNLGYQSAGVNDHASPYHRVLLGAQNAAGDKLQHVLVLADDDGVTGVVSASDARDIVERAGQVIHHLALAFVTPLRSYDYHRFHSDAPVDRTRPRTFHGGLLLMGITRYGQTSNRKLAKGSTQDGAGVWETHRAESLFWCQLRIAETVDHMIVHHAGGLHQGVADCRTYEAETTFLQVFAEGVGFGGASR